MSVFDGYLHDCNVFSVSMTIWCDNALQTRSCVRQIFKDTLEICVTGLGWAEHLAIFATLCIGLTEKWEDCLVTFILWNINPNDYD